jgi:hypothetical protein
MLHEAHLTLNDSATLSHGQNPKQTCTNQISEPAVMQHLGLSLVPQAPAHPFTGSNPHPFTQQPLLQTPNPSPVPSTPPLQSPDPKPSPKRPAPSPEILSLPLAKRSAVPHDKNPIDKAFHPVPHQIHVGESPSRLQCAIAAPQPFRANTSPIPNPGVGAATSSPPHHVGGDGILGASPAIGEAAELGNEGVASAAEYRTRRRPSGWDVEASIEPGGDFQPLPLGAAMVAPTTWGLAALFADLVDLP